jgi:diguanylate cyclase
MTALIFLIAGLCLFVGYHLGRYVASAGSNPHWAEDLPRDDISAELDAENALSLLDSIRQLTNTVHDEVDRRAGDSQGAAELNSTASLSEATIVLSAATRMLEANKQLLTDLSFAKAEIFEQQEMLGSVQSQAITDELTGLLNRRALNQELPRLREESERSQSPLCFLLVDLDHFKKFNDRFGHLVGDELLQFVASTLKQSTSGRDIVTRFGGEEFACVLPNTSLDHAAIPADRIREAVESLTYKLDERELHITVSVGYAEAQPDETTEQLIQRADMALYAAKAAGRNCCCFHDGQTCQSLQGKLFDLDSLSAAMTEVKLGASQLFTLERS